MSPINTKLWRQEKRGRRGETEKRQGRDRIKKREQKTGEHKNQRKREPITKKKKQGKEKHSSEKTITAIFVSAFVFVIAK